MYVRVLHISPELILKEGWFSWGWGGGEGEWEEAGKFGLAKEKSLHFLEQYTPAAQNVQLASLNSL